MTHQRTRGWRKTAFVAGSLAALAVGGSAGVSQAGADPGQPQDQQASKAPSKAQVKKPQATKQQETKQDPLEQYSQFAPMDPLPGGVTGRETAVALQGAVAELVPGEASGFWGQGGYGDWRQSAASFRLEPADGSSPGWVSVGVMHESMYPGYVPTCDDPLGGYGDSCHLSEQADGSTLVTYSHEKANGWKTLIVDRYVGDIRVSVSADNNTGSELPSAPSTVKPSGTAPALDLEQLVSIAEEAWWSVDGPLDAPYEDTLPSFDEHAPVVIG